MNETAMSRLYESDFYQWTREQSQALKELINSHHELKQIQTLDWENIIEEIEALGRSEYGSVVSLLRRQIEHRLKIDYVPLPECYKKWEKKVLTFKKNIKPKFAPSMKNKLQQQLDDIFKDAVELVEFEYDINLPKECPYSLDELLP